MSSVLPARALSFLRRNMTNNDNAVYCYIRDDDDNFALFGQHSLEKSTNANVVHNKYYVRASANFDVSTVVDRGRARAEEEVLTRRRFFHLGVLGGKNSHSK